jgi:WD40 repeat protein
LSGQQVAQWYAHAGGVESVSFSADGQHIGTTGDGKIRLWNLLGRQLAEFDGGEMSFSPNGNLMAIGFGDSVQIWPIEDLDALLKRGCLWLKDYLANHPDAPKVCPKHQQTRG